MKHKFSSMGRVAIALVLALSLSLVMAVPAAASHDSTATVAFTLNASTQQGQASSLDVTVTNSAGSLGNINEVVIDFNTGTAETEFTVANGVVDGPGSWGGMAADGIVTFIGGTIAPAAEAVFVIPVTNPTQLGSVPNPTVSATDAGSDAKLEASEATGWIGYIAVPSGTAGNDITIEYADAAPYSALSVTVDGNAISVELADSGSGPTSTAILVKGAIDLSDAGDLVATTVASEDESQIVPVMSVTALSGGSIAMVDKPCDVTGELVITELLLTVVITATPDTSASVASYDIAFTTIEVIAINEAITITFPAEYNLTLVDPAVNVALTATPPGVPYTTAAITKLGQVVTITADDTTPIAGATVPVVVTIDNVENPPVSDDYNIAVLTSAGDHGAGAVTIIPDSFGVVAGALNEVTAGTPFAVTLQALNASADPDTGYTGAHYIEFVWVVTATKATIPDYELITFAAGAGTSPANFILTKTGESPTVKASEGTLIGTSTGITINPGALDDFTITNTTKTTVAGAIFGAVVKVEAFDAYANLKTDYTGTVTWTSSDTAAGVKLPSDYPFTTGVDGEDNGVHDFVAGDFILVTVGEVAGVQTITVTDGEVFVSDEVTVTAAAAHHLTAVASVDFIVADDTDTSTITASARDEFGNVVLSGEDIAFDTNLGELFGLSQSEGVATVYLKSSEIGTATIKVTSTSLTTPITRTVKLEEPGTVFSTYAFDYTVPDPIVVDTPVKVPVTFATDVVGDVSYGLVRFSFTVVGPEDGVVTFEAKDSLGDPYTVTLPDPDPNKNFGVWGPDTGFPLPVQYTATTDWTLSFSKVGTYTITFNCFEIAKFPDGDPFATGSEVVTVVPGIELYEGWNLISLPLIPTDADIDLVLAGVTVVSVWAYDASIEDPLERWSSYKPGAPGDLDTMIDGKGYLVQMSAPAVLTICGKEFPDSPSAPRSYDVVVGWNLIGFKSLISIDAYEYLDELATVTQAMYGYDAVKQAYTTVVVSLDGPDPDKLDTGKGYWLAVSEEGTIYP